MKKVVGLRLSGAKILAKLKAKPGSTTKDYKGICKCGSYFRMTHTQILNCKKAGLLQCPVCADKVTRVRKSIDEKPSKKPRKGNLDKGVNSAISLYTVWESLANRNVPYAMFYDRYVRKNWHLKKALSTAPQEEDIEAGRRQVTSAVTSAVMGYLLKKGYGIYREMGVKKWGARRVDVCGVNLYGYLVVCEVKSGMADYRADQKMHEYLPYCNKMYVAFPHTMKITDAIKKEITSKGIGIMVLEANGLIRVRARAKHRLILPKDRDDLIWRMVWRGAVTSARTTKRTKEFI